MKIWIIKHQGANWWANLCSDTEIEFSDGSGAYCGRFFNRKKDAVKFRNINYKDNPYLEVVWAELKPSTKDNRKL